MGVASSAVTNRLAGASDEELLSAVAALPADQRARLQAALSTPAAATRTFDSFLVERADGLRGKEASAKKLIAVPVLCDLAEARSEMDGLAFSQLLAAGFVKLLSCKAHLNKINVFPIADGDTGT